MGLEGRRVVTGLGVGSSVVGLGGGLVWRRELRGLHDLYGVHGVLGVRWLEAEYLGIGLSRDLYLHLVGGLGVVEAPWW
jgi:hypothetical protein